MIVFYSTLFHSICVVVVQPALSRVAIRTPMKNQNQVVVCGGWGDTRGWRDPSAGGDVSPRVGGFDILGVKKIAICDMLPLNF